MTYLIVFHPYSPGYPRVIHELSTIFSTVIPLFFYLLSIKKHGYAYRIPVFRITHLAWYKRRFGVEAAHKGRNQAGGVEGVIDVDHFVR